MRYAARTDRNQQEIVDALRAVGATVWPSHRYGDGFPDLVVGHHGEIYLLEVKDGDKPPSAQKLTPAESTFHSMFPDHAHIVNSVASALELVGC